jgi:uncharacterized damage-inducible protein DinB
MNNIIIQIKKMNTIYKIDFDKLKNDDEYPLHTINITLNNVVDMNNKIINELDNIYDKYHTKNNIMHDDIIYTAYGIHESSDKIINDVIKILENYKNNIKLAKIIVCHYENKIMCFNVI